MLRRFKSNLLALTLSLMSSLIAAEVVLRLMLPPPTVFKHPQETYVFDEQIGFRLTPDQTSYTHDKPVSVNSHGVRGPEYSPEPSAGTYRIVAVGDSQTFGNGVALEDTWPGMLQRISSDGQHRVEVINGGTPATDTWQHEILAMRLAAQYKPDALIIAVYVNDIREAQVHREGAVFESNSRLQRLKYLLKRSVIVASTSSAYREYGARKALNTAPQWEQKVVQGIYDPAIELAWTQVETSLRSVKDWSEGMNLYVLVVALPHRAQVSGSMTGGAHNRRLLGIAQRNGIPFLDLLPALTEAHGTHGSELFIPWDGHNSAIANQVIAAQVYEEISHAITSRGSTR